MKTTTYYNLNIAEGTDIVNPLTVDNPNYQKIDEAMHDNAVACVTLATEITNSTIHALTRENSDCSVIRFIATSRWKAGDSVTVDGVPVLALLPSGETLPDGAYVINANVLCVLTGTNLTVYVSKSSANASDITYNETNVEAALNSLNESMVTVTSNLSTVSSNVSTLTTSLEEVSSNLTSLKDYSTEETVVGTWIDGKPIYRKCYVGTPNLSITNEMAAYTIPNSINCNNIDTLINVSANYRGDSSNDTIAPYTYYRTTNVVTTYDIDASGIRLFRNGQALYSYVVVVEYTKA